MRLFPNSLHRTSFVAILAILLVAVTWWTVWTIAASRYRAAIDEWIASGRASGYQIEYDSREMFGFPHHVVLRFANLRWKNTNGITFHADGMDLSSVPWEWRAFDARFKGHVEIAAPLDAEGHALTLAGEEGRAHVDLDADGVWNYARVFLTHAKVGRSLDYLCTAESLEATASRPAQPPKTQKEAGLTLGGTAENVVIPQSMPSPFGPNMAHLEMNLRVMGEVPDFRKRDSVAVWNTAMGVVQFDRLNMTWGPLVLTGKGTIGFDDELQPEGAFSTTIGNHTEVLKALMDHGFIAQRQGGMLNEALSLFAKPSGTTEKGGSSAIEVPIAVQLNGLFLGPVRVFMFPEIEWPKSGGAPVTPAPAAPPT